MHLQERFSHDRYISSWFLDMRDGTGEKEDCGGGNEALKEEEVIRADRRKM